MHESRIKEHRYMHHVSGSQIQDHRYMHHTDMHASGSRVKIIDICASYIHASESRIEEHRYMHHTCMHQDQGSHRYASSIYASWRIKASRIHASWIHAFWIHARHVMHHGYHNQNHWFLHHRYMHHGHICVGQTAWRARRTKSSRPEGPKAGLKGRKLEVGPRRGPRPLVHIYVFCKTNMKWYIL